MLHISGSRNYDLDAPDCREEFRLGNMNQVDQTFLSPSAFLLLGSVIAITAQLVTLELANLGTP